MPTEIDKAVIEKQPRESADQRMAKLGHFPISPIRSARGNKPLFGYGTKEQAERYQRGEIMLTMPTKDKPQGEIVEVPAEKRVPHVPPARRVQIEAQ
jgi:hypothetical protein